MSEQAKKRKKKKRKLRGGTKVAIVIVSIILAVVALGGIGYGVYRNYYGKMNVEESYIRTELGRGMRRILAGDSGTLMQAEHVYNVLLIGQDTRVEGENRRSDSMILVSINEHTEEIVLTSIMRDSWVYIPGLGAHKINEAYTLGGPDKLIETIEINFDVKIDNYVAVDFWAFMDIVDILGGVEMTVTDDEVENLNLYLRESINVILGRSTETDVLGKGGTYVLNGAQTLAYCRCRYVDSEAARTGRQRKVISAIFEEVKDSDLGELTALLEAVLPYVTTDIDSDKLLSLMMDFVAQYKDYELVQYRVPYEGSYEVWYNDLTGIERYTLSLDIEANSAYMIQNIYGVNVLEEEE